MKGRAEPTTSRGQRARSGRTGRTGLDGAQRATVEAWTRSAIAQVLLDHLDGSPEPRQEVSAALEELGCKPLRPVPYLRLLEDDEGDVEGRLDGAEGTPYSHGEG